MHEGVSIPASVYCSGIKDKKFQARDYFHSDTSLPYSLCLKQSENVHSGAMHTSSPLGCTDVETTTM